MSDGTGESAVVGPVSGAITHRVFAERLSLFFRSLLLSNSVVIANSLLLAYILQTPENRRTVILWAGVSLTVALFRFTTLLRYSRQDFATREDRAGQWHREILFGVALSGATWGAAGYLLFDLSDVVNQSFLAFVLAGMCAGAIVSLSAFFEAAATFLVLSLLPFFLRLLQELNPDTAVMAVMVLLYLSMMLVFARRVNQTVISGLQMSYLRSDAEATIERQALYDDLTGLPNRRLLQDRLARTAARSRRHETHAALLFLDLDFFKRVNDGFGHAVGDEMLVEVARRISSRLREEDTAARLGGDEFVALLEDLSGDLDSVLSLVRRRGEELRSSIEAPMNLSGNQLHVTVSIGVSLLPGDTDNSEDLLKHADTAMYRAKDEGRNTLRFFVAEMQEALLKRLDVERRLRAAIQSGEGLSLHLQPQYTERGDICGAEALLRWKCDGQFISPATFIPVAEDSGLIYSLGDWVVNEACRIGERIGSDFATPGFSLAINVSPRQFREKDFVTKLVTAMERHGLPRGLIELELTERLLIDNMEDTVDKIRRLRERGLRFSIDDFGTGYSSLSYLKALPLDALKIDQSFVRDLLTDPGDASIVQAIISVARTLQLEVIAEGVESRAIHEFLVNRGCRRFQGFLYSPAVPLDAFLALQRHDAIPQEKQ
jgi:diguanylate cyclase (GGDEF)-like protein